jgi:hypothetical protein
MERTASFATHYRPGITFLAEQDGAPERALKAAFAKILTTTPHVQRAYLALVKYDKAGGYEVALCLCSGNGADENLVQALGAAFAQQFGATEHLDILFLETRQEKALAEVCQPFYSGRH